MIGEFKKLQALFFLISAIVGVTLYFHTTFATTKRVEGLESKMEIVQDILCAIAIEQGMEKAARICSLRND